LGSEFWVLNYGWEKDEKTEVGCQKAEAGGQRRITEDGRLMADEQGKTLFVNGY